MKAVCVLVGILSTIVGHGQVLTALGGVVSPGKTGHIRLEWAGLVQEENLALDLEAEGYFTFFGLPSVGSSNSGSSVLLFMVHPNTPAGLHNIKITLEGRGTDITSSIAQVDVERKHGIESVVLEEQRESAEVLHSNTGNTTVDIGVALLSPGTSFKAKYQRSGVHEIDVHATAQEWDSTYTLSLKKRFYPATSIVDVPRTAPLVNYQLQHQWSSAQSFSSGRLSYRRKQWSLNLVSWNRFVRGAVIHSAGENHLELGRQNFQASSLLRPRVQWYTERAYRGWSGFISEYDLGAHKRWMYDKHSFSAGGMYLDGRVLPHLKANVDHGRNFISYKGVGGLQEAAWGLQSGPWNSHGRVLSVPKNWQDRSLQQSNALIGNSLKWGLLKIHQQSAFYRHENNLVQLHNAQMQLQLQKFQWNIRGIYSSTGFAQYASQASYRMGQHSIVFRQQSSVRKAAVNTNWMGQYYWRSGHGNLSVSAQKLVSGWAFRSYGGWSAGSYSFHLQGGYASSPSIPWFYQASISKRVNHQVIALVSSRRMPVQLALQGSLFSRNTSKSLEGHVVGIDGHGLKDVIIRCNDRTVQTDGSGYFRFDGLESTATLEIDAASMPFAQFPIAGYKQVLTLASKQNRVAIACYKSGGIQGSVVTRFSNAIGLRNAIELPSLKVFLQGEADSYQCAVDASGAFRISGVTPGSYELRIDGLKKGFKFSPTSVVVTDGNVLPVALHIEELEETIPMQQL